jgi:hypothetical protein
MVTMDSNAVRQRIIEVGQLVKEALRARPVGASCPQQDCQVVADARRLFWNEERGYKYIDDVKQHLGRLFWSFERLDPLEGTSVFEIGPGNCYFLFMCRELRACRPAGIDVKHSIGSFDVQATYAFGLFRKHFGMEDAIRHQVVQGHRPIDFRGEYDYIVATRAMFNLGWREAEYRFWLRDCYEHLRPEGRLMVHLNKIDPESLAALPLLRPLDSPRKVRKLTIIARETLGRLIGQANGKG